MVEHCEASDGEEAEDAAGRRTAGGSEKVGHLPGGHQVSSISLTVMLQPDSPLLVAPEMLLQLAGGDIGQLTDF
jgi:hypothetical protein